MFFFSAGILTILTLIFIFPFLLLSGYFHILVIGFENLGLSSETAFFILILILFGSVINIPLTKIRIEYIGDSSFLGFFRRQKFRGTGIAINVGGGLIPVLLSFYFLYKGWSVGCSLADIGIAILLLAIISKFSAKVIPGKGITLSPFIPPIFAVLFAFIFTPDFPALTAFISGTLGVLIGADILNLKKAQKTASGMISIGGAGIFDGIFLVGIVAALLAGF